MTSPLPSDDLELRAEYQRQRLQNSVYGLRSSVQERLNAHNVARSYFWQASGIAALVAFALGYGIGGAFSD